MTALHIHFVPKKQRKGNNGKKKGVHNDHLGPGNDFLRFSICMHPNRTATLHRRRREALGIPFLLKQVPAGSRTFLGVSPFWGHCHMGSYL